MPATRSHRGLSTPGEPGLRAAWARSGAVRTGPAPGRRGPAAAREEPEEPAGHGSGRCKATSGEGLGAQASEKPVVARDAWEVQEKGRGFPRRADKICK